LKALAEVIKKYLPFSDFFEESPRLAPATVETQLSLGSTVAMEYAIRLCKGIMQQLQPNLEGLLGLFPLTLEDGDNIEQKILHRHQISLQNFTGFLLVNNIFQQLHQLADWSEDIHGFLNVLVA
jgi:hypothetical protein